MKYVVENESLQVKSVLGEHALGNKDLGLSIVKRDMNTTLNFDTVGGVEDVAYGLAFVEGLGGDLTCLLVFGVGESNKELSSRESVKRIVSVSLNMGLFPDFRILSSWVNLSDLLVKRRLSVEVVPQGLSVVWIITSAKELLRSIVDEWNTSAGHREDNGAGESDMVSVVVQETSVVVVINKDSQGINVFEFALLLLVSSTDIVHALLILPYI